MKKFITLAFSILFTMTAFGQRLEYEKSSKWFFGLNAGATWNTTDVQNKTYAGWGFVLGRSYNYDYGRRISYDLRLRYLHGKWYGQDTDSTNLSHLGADYSGALADYKNGLGYTVNNYEANVHELGLELAIHFNRLRDRSGWDPYIFGGANIVWNETYGDLLDQDVFLFNDSMTYAYDQIDMNKPAIEFALDENYESALDGTNPGRFNVNFMPSLGVGLGYDFGPRFSMGVEHKTTFALKDDFDGYVDAEPNWGFLQNDVYHYTSAYMVWRFRNGEGRTRPTPITQPDPNVNGIGSTPPCQLPQVRYTKPLQRTETVQSQSYVFRAEVRYVQSRSQIVMRVNGVQTTNFLYNHETHQLESYLNLQPGNNVIEVTGTNSCGNDTETATIIFNNCITPNVYFQNVNNNTFNAEVEQRAYTVRAQIANATSVEFTVNGVRSTNFVYNSATGQFSSNVMLNDGQNTFRIVAISPCGNDVGTGVVTYTNCASPFVNFANGNGGFVAVSQANYNVSAYVYNAVSSNNIKLRVNGSTRNFSYNASTNQLTANVSLNSGQNTIQISVTNNCGTDTETITVEYTPCVNPSIQMLNPLAQSTTTANGVQVVKAKLYNIANVSQVQLFVNGNIQQGGSYNAITKEFQASVALNAGINTIQITVINDCGSDTETISVNYVPCNTPDVQLIMPSANGTVVSSPSQLVQAMVFNANNIGEIQTFVNGTLQQGGSFNSSNGLYQITVGLNLGVNTIQVVATNSCGTDVQTVSVTYRACEAPQITMMNPTTDPLFTTATNINISAVIAAISNASQVQLKVNGVVDASGATYSSASITYNNNVNLNVGNNNIIITATNSCGAVTKEINIVREVVVVNTPNDEDSIVICYPRSNGEPITMTIPLSQWPTYQNQGAQLGPCPVINEPVDEPMTICYTVNGTPTTMQILTSEWPAYQALGANQGVCPEATMNICFNGNQLTIPVSQWTSYQAQGATEGPCQVVVEEKIIICHKPPGNPTNTQELEIPLSAWPAHQAHGDVLGPCPVEDPEMTICLNNSTMTILTSQWATYQAQGATQGPCPVVEEKIIICHKPPGNPTNTQELEIPLSAWPAHQAHGDVLGPCPVEDPEMTICLNNSTMTILTSQWATYQAQGATQGPCPVVEEKIIICHKPPGNPTNTQELEIPLSAWPAHQAHGDVLGPCPVEDPEMTICLNNSTMTILTSQWATYQAQGATEGPCPVVEEKIIICHKPPGNPTNTQELEIPLSAWPAHQAHGDVLGPCPVEDPEMTICLNNSTMTILTSQWATYQAQGATQGPCPVVEEKIIICHKPPGNPTNTQELEIPLSAWPAHQAHGDVLGPCPTSQKMTICLNNKTMEIEVSKWARYQAQGATLGACPNNGTVDGNGQNIINSDTLNTINRPTDGGDEDELLFGNRTMTICYTPEGSIASQTMQIPISQWQEYQSKGATLGACTGSGTINIPSGGSGTINQNTNGTSNGQSVGNVPNNPNGNDGSGGNPPTGGNMQQIGNGSQEAQNEQLKLEQAAEKARQEQAAKDAAAKKAQEEAQRKAEEQKRQEAAAEKARQEQAAKDAAAKKAQEEAQRKAEEQKRQAAAAEKARQEQATKDVAAKKAQEEAQRKAEEQKRQEAAAEKAHQEQAAKDAAAKKAQEEAQRKAEEQKRQAAAAEKARQEQAAREAAAKKAQEEAQRKAEEQKRQAAAAEKARQEQAAREAAAKKAQEEAQRKAEEQKRQAAAAEKARQEQAAREAAAKKAQEEKRKAAAAEKARQEQAAKEAAAKKAQEAAAEKARQEKAAKEAAEKKAAEEAAKKKAEEQRKTNERGGGL